MTTDRTRGGRSRREILRAGAILTAAAPIASGAVTACGRGYAAGPDALLPLLEAARADADAAGTLAASGSGERVRLAEAVSRVRGEHADALRTEIDRLNRPRPENPATRRPRPDSVSGLSERLAAAREQASSLVPALPRHRAGLVGSVAAGCAGLQELAPELGGGTPAPSVSVRPASTAERSDETIRALEQALAAEYAAVWIYGLVTAYLPPAFSGAIGRARAAHRDRRDAAREVLAAAGADPKPTETAYLPAKPVTDEASALRVVVTAEADAAEAWHGVLVRSEDTALPAMATSALVGSAAQATRWRAEAGTRPAALALPGRR